MELIVTFAVLGLVAYWVWDMSQKEKKNSDTRSDQDKPWPFGEKVAEGKIHVKSTDVAPGKSPDDRVEATAPKCGCGRSPTGFCVGLHKLTAEAWAVSDQNPNRVEAVANITADSRAKAVMLAKAATKKGAHEGNKAPVKRAPRKKKST